MILSFLFSQSVWNARLALSDYEKKMNIVRRPKLKRFENHPKTRFYQSLADLFWISLVVFPQARYHSVILLSDCGLWFIICYILFDVIAKCCELSVALACLSLPNAGPLRSAFALRDASTCWGLHMSHSQFNVKIRSFNPCRLKKLWIYFFFSMSNNLDPEIICI